MEQLAQMKFGWDVTELPEYTNEEKMEMLRRQVLTGNTLDIISIQEGVKHKEPIKTFDTDVEWATGDGCGFNPSGDTSFTDREIAVSNIKLEKSFCNLDLLDKWTQKALRAGSIAELEEFPFQDAVTAHLLEKNARELEKAVWRGDASLTSGNLQFFDGFEELFSDNSASMIDINTNSDTAFTAANAYDIIFNAFMDMDADENGQAVLEGEGEARPVAFVTRTQFNLLIKNITDENKFHFDTTEATAGGEFILPGTDLRIVKVNGRTDNSKFYIANPVHMVFGTDLETDPGQVKIWYNEDEEEIRARIRFKAGVQVAFLNTIGYWEAAAS